MATSTGAGSAALKLITWGPVGKTHSSVTPFGSKVEVALRLAGIDYSVEAGDPTNSKVFVKQKARPQHSYNTVHISPDSLA